MRSKFATGPIAGDPRHPRRALSSLSPQELHHVARLVWGPGRDIPPPAVLVSELAHELLRNARFSIMG